MGVVKVSEGHECAFTIRRNIDIGTHVHRGITMWGHIEKTATYTQGERPQNETLLQP